MSESNQPFDPAQHGQPPQYGGPQQGGQPQSYGQQSALSPQEERTWGALAHGAAVIAMVLSAGTLGFLGSLAVYLVYKDRSAFVRTHSANSLNVQITMFIWLVGLVVAGLTIGILTLGLALIAIVPLFIAAPFVAGLLHVIGAIKAYNGESWNPPLTVRILS